MSATNDIIDLRAQDRPSTARARAHAWRSSGAPHTERDTHLLRLSLDLQLDALLLTLGAAAAHEGPPSQGESGHPLEGVRGHAGGQGSAVDNGATALPWKRWLEEDLELAMTLAATALALDSALPPALGAPPAQDDRAPAVEVAENLLARFEAMCSLLTDLLEREERATDPGQVMAPWQPPVSRALRRCRQRVEELQRHVEAVTRARPAGGRPPAWTHDHEAGAHSVWPQRDRTPVDMVDHRFLPGELLG